ncbi:hypothetical protein CXB51_010947 [Gossypium anomalum]|uniref:DUF4283 domain-containing protein n=1 Tax=Gossypium anomalum TaxID=47600 RepID=A0A8J5YUZ3_9ROSI|nr:hypothetical protein CXB51_010947 [Gossypium anomalum]
MANKLQAIWGTKQALQVINLDNDYFFVKFQDDEDYLETLSGGRGQSLSLLKFIGSTIGPVAKIDRNTNNCTRGQFARLAVYIDLGKPLVSKKMSLKKHRMRIMVKALQRKEERMKSNLGHGWWWSADNNEEEFRFAVLRGNHRGMKDGGLNTITNNEGNRDSETVIADQNLLVKEKTIPLIKSRGFKK